MSGLSVVNPADDLPEPIAIEVVDDEALLAAWKVQFKALWPAYNVDGLEFDYGVVNAQAMSILRTLDRARVNDAYRAGLLALAEDTNLDALAAGLGLKRSVYLPATATTDAVVEEDDDLRENCWLEIQRWARGGSNLGMQGLASRFAQPDTTDIRVDDFPGKGRQRCILLPRQDLDAAGRAALLARVSQGVLRRDMRFGSVPCDTVLAEELNLDLVVTLGVLPGASQKAAKAAGYKAVATYLGKTRRIGWRVAMSRVEGDACVTNVVYARVAGMTADLLPALDQAYQLRSLQMIAEVARA